VKILGKAVTKTISKVTVGKVAKKTLKGKSTKKGIKLTWKKVSNSTGYIVMRSTKKKSGYKVIKTITKKSTVSFLDKKAKKGKTYYYKVVAYKKVGSAKLKSKATKIVKVKRKKK
jgi:fibronectin type 3 domain-containing protein